MPVPIDLFVMSKCPDAVYCESVFSTVLKKVNAEVVLNFNYIAQYNGSEPFAHSCMHGTSECLGNIQQLCFQHEYPDPHDWFAFALCLNKQYHQIGLDNKLAQYCAKQVRRSYSPVEKCTNSSLGVGLLTESAQKTKQLGVRCTIFIDNKLRCVHDGSWKVRNCPGGWKVEDFIQTIEDAYYK
ncbi:hypothetical protein [Absidia glauca]|uniref:Thioredoxin-like fold domain-containing protein n=1 Tax=Absidia glauca TaxID=4829 RepID=A0A163J2R5_ABSGL|nr:hypothetical protein [Absidia glauca]